MHEKLRLKAIVGMSLCLAAACGDQAERQPVRVFQSPAALDEQVVWIDRSGNRALMLDVSARTPEPEVTAHSVASNPVALTRRNQHNELLLLARGASSGDGILTVLGPKGVDREYALGSRFNHVSQSQDGRFAIARFGEENLDDESLLFNPSEIAVVDLDEDEDDGVTLRSLRSLGSTIRDVQFSPPMEVAGETRRIAVVLFASHVSLLDLNHPDRPEYTVELSLGSNIGLQSVRFSPDEQRIYLTGTQSNDIYVLTLLPASGNRTNDFEPSRNQLGAGARPLDMQLYQSGSETRLLATSGNEALVIQSSSNRVTRIPLESPADRILLYEGRTPFDEAIEQRALLYRLGSDILTFLDLDDVEERRTRNLELLSVSGGVSQLTPLQNNLVLLMLTNGLGLLDLDGRSASELSSQVDLSTAVASLELNRLWIRPQGRAALAYLDFSDGKSSPGQVALDAPVQDLLVFSNMDRKRVVVTHDSAGGAVTILSAEDPEDKQQSLTLRGFFYSNLFDEEL